MTGPGDRSEPVAPVALVAPPRRASTLQGCTIIARNYLAHARVLARSFLDYHPGATFSVLVVDDPLGRGSGADAEPFDAEPFEVIGHDLLALDRTILRTMTLIYDVMELSTAVKPWLLSLLLDRGRGPVVFLDPDVCVYRPVDHLGAAAERSGIALVPHVLRPLPQDGCYPTEQDLLIAGIFNLGVIAVAESGGTRDFLRWWKGHMRFDAIAEPATGHFTDQRPLDLVPVFFRHEVVRDPGCDVAYWNAHERPLRKAGAGFLAGGAPLRFLHFSGFDPAQPHVLSRHGRDRPRVLLSEHPHLRDLCADYARRLVEEGWAEARALPYRWARLPDGTPIDQRLRRRYREELLAARRDGTEGPPRPEGPGWCGRFLDWWAGPGPSGLPRPVAEVYAQRLDLQQAFPDPLGADAEGFDRWLDEYLPHEVDLAPQVLGRMAAARAARAAPAWRRPPAGTTAVVGYLRAELGIGEAARRLAIALEAAGERVALVDHHGTATSRRHAALPATTGELGAADTVVLGINADMTAQFALGPGAEVLRGRHVIGYWFWEVDVLPRAMRAAFRFVDEVWVATEHVARALRPIAPVPVHVVPLPVLVPTAAPLDRDRLGLDGGPIVSAVCDLASVPERKNPHGAVACYVRAVPVGSPAQLVVKTVHGARQRLALERLHHLAVGRPDVHVLDGFWPAEELAGLLQASACHLSLHRAEGLGLVVADALALDRPTITTGYGGVLDLCAGDEGWWLVPGREGPVGPGAAPYPPEARWMEPDVGTAASLLAGVLADPDGSARRAAAAGERLRRRWTPEGCGARARQLIESRRHAAVGSGMVSS